MTFGFAARSCSQGMNKLIVNHLGRHFATRTRQVSMYQTFHHVVLKGASDLKAWKYMGDTLPRSSAKMLIRFVFECAALDGHFVALQSIAMNEAGY